MQKTIDKIVAEVKANGFTPKFEELIQELRDRAENLEVDYQDAMEQVIHLEKLYDDRMSNNDFREIEL